LALSVEQINCVRRPKYQQPRCTQGIKVHLTLRSGMNATEVDDQLPIDEDPHIIVAGEADEFTTIVHKL